MIDEVQRINDIGLKLKAIIDTIPDFEIIATGSSAIDLSNFTNESLTGRKFEYALFPLSTDELYSYDGIASVKSELHHRLIYVNYPEVYLDNKMPVEIIKEIAG